jgi:hypothetical protein
MKNNCMFIAATKFLGFEPPTISTGEVHEEIIIDLAIHKGMCPVRVNFFPVSADQNGLEVPVYTEEEATKRFQEFCEDCSGIIIGKRNGVWHADTDVSNFDVIERGIFNIC